MPQNIVRIVLMLALTAALAGCGHSPGERAVTGGLIGAGAGAAIGAAAGNPVGGAVAGGAIGAVGGAVTAH
jgi:hypothetical protein